MSENFYHTVDMFIQLLGAEKVSHTDIFFRISRAAIGANVDYSEIQRILGEITSFSTWFDAWQKSADRFAALAVEAESNGHPVTAGENYLRAGQLYHFAQLFTRPEDPRRAQAGRQRVFYYRKAGPLLKPPVQAVEIPLGGQRLPGYLRCPDGLETPPVVVLVPGANSVKEELHNWGGEFLKRGMATRCSQRSSSGNSTC